MFPYDKLVSVSGALSTLRQGQTSPLEEEGHDAGECSFEPEEEGESLHFFLESLC